MAAVRRAWTGVLLACGAVPLAGCLPMMAANVTGKAVVVARGRPANNEGSGEKARGDCVARAQAYGAVHVINVEQHSPSTIVVWGTTETDKGRQSFKCVYGTEIRSFTLRPIPAHAG
jgi:hypothetical protein